MGVLVCGTEYGGVRPALWGQFCSTCRWALGIEHGPPAYTASTGLLLSEKYWRGSALPSCLQVLTESCQCSCPGSAFQGQRSLCRSSRHSLQRSQLAESGCGLSPSPSSERRCHSKTLCRRAVQPWSWPLRRGGEDVHGMQVIKHTAGGSKQ